MNNKVYDIFKFSALIALPAVTTFVGVTLEALNVGCTGTVVTIMTAFNVMLGTIIERASSTYKKKTNENGVG